jgi:hypothetical protein
VEVILASAGWNVTAGTKQLSQFWNYNLDLALLRHSTFLNAAKSEYAAKRSALSIRHRGETTKLLETPAFAEAVRTTSRARTPQLSLKFNF